MKTAKKTPLYDRHVSLGGKMIDFAGYQMPVQYKGGVISEHMAVREKAGMFDVSHMGEVIFRGPGSLACLNRLMTGDFSDMDKGQIRYALMCSHTGGVIDDLLVYKTKDDEYMVVINGANIEKDVNWMKEHLALDTEFVDVSEKTALIALQGPEAENTLKKTMGDKACYIPEKYYTFSLTKVPVLTAGRVPDGEAADENAREEIPCTLSRTGYTGEDGFELYVDSDQAERLWDTLFENGKQYGLTPCGLGARDTLRLEAGMPLYGNDLDETITPLEAGLGRYVNLNKDNFIGLEELRKKAAEIAADDRARIAKGIKAVGKGIIRGGETLYQDGKEVGRTTSGSHLPYLGYSGAMALIEKAAVEESKKEPLYAVVRGRKIPVEIVKLPFYKRA